MKQWIIWIAALWMGWLWTGCQKEGTPEQIMYYRSKEMDVPLYIFGDIDSKCFIFIVHGGPGATGLDYRINPYSRLLEEHYAVVYADQRGQGNSHGHYDKEAVNVADAVADMYGMIRMLKAHYGEDISIFLMGHSWGGLLGSAYMVTAEHQHQLKGWIEVDGAHNYPKTYLDGYKMLKDSAEHYLAMGATDTAFWNTLLRDLAPLDTTNIDFPFALKVNQWAFRTPSHLFGVNMPVADYSPEYDIDMRANLLMGDISNPLFLLQDSVLWLDLTPELHKITIPTMVIWGRADIVVPPTLAYDAYHAVSSVDKQLVFFQHSEHSPMITEPDSFVQVVRAFVDARK